MRLEVSQIKNLILYEPRVFEDERGWFMEAVNKAKLIELGMDPLLDFIQVNHSLSKPKILRGMHFQKGDAAQDKLVRVIRGKVFDVAVDLRPDSPTYKSWAGVELSAENKNVFFVPKGFAHGFVVLGDEDVEFEYLVTTPYNKEADGGIIWNDPDIGIEWPVTDPIISEKDSQLPLFKDLGKVF